MKQCSIGVKNRNIAGLTPSALCDMVSQMRPYFLLFIVAILTGIVSGQQPTRNNGSSSQLAPIEARTADGKRVLLRADGTWIWAEEQNPGPAAAPPTAEAVLTTPEKLVLFPADYDNKLVRLSDLRIGQLRYEASQKAYLLEVTSADGKYFPNIMLPGLIFVMNEEWARGLNTIYEKNGVDEHTKMIVAMVAKIKIVKLPLGESAAAVPVCIEFYNYAGKVNETLGTCK
jgi:hypothetical protein